jgi:hypothetical protein
MPVYFDMRSNYTVDDVGAKFAVIGTLGSEKLWQHVTAICDSELRELCQGTAANEANNHMSDQLIGD